MREEFLTPAAILAQSILQSVSKSTGELSEDVVASAFLTAYRAIEQAETEAHKDS